MLCSECKKNTAILFINNLDKEGKDSLQGLCYDCAKAKGIDPLEVLSKQNNILGNDVINLNNMSGQFESILKDLSQNLNLENMDLSNLEESNEKIEDIEGENKGFPLGSIFAGIIRPNSENENESSSLGNNSSKKVKPEKRKKEKKRKFLDTYGTI